MHVSVFITGDMIGLVNQSHGLTLTGASAELIAAAQRREAQPVLAALLDRYGAPLAPVDVTAAPQVQNAGTLAADVLAHRLRETGILP